MVQEHKYSQWGKNVLSIEIKTLQNLERTIQSSEFHQACDTIFDAAGKLIVLGIGKSGHIGRKIASTFASTGTPSFFVHPSEAAHGDLGMLESQDVALMISYSGESPEISALLPLLTRKNIKIISITGNTRSTLAQAAQISLVTSISQEACPLGLAPTASTTAALVLGDAMAIALLTHKGFTKQDFAFRHPGGKLGQQLITRVNDIMYKTDRMPIVPFDASLPESLLEMSTKGLGMTAVADKEKRLIGIFTDGDLRRALDQHIDIYSCCIQDVMTRIPITVESNALAVQALSLMRQHKISGVYVVDREHRALGAVHLNTLVELGLT